MRAFRGVFILVLALALSAPVLAADHKAGLEAYQRKDYATALKEWRPLAERGDAAAQVGIGSMYRFGFGVAQDYVEAVTWPRRNASRGNGSRSSRCSPAHGLEGFVKE